MEEIIKEDLKDLSVEELIETEIALIELENSIEDILEENED